ncbi:unnamed protein product [Bemisia tabaci]|uniref:WW domain-containing protein n=2 Tax=Bemisia tabaci TaxID=7038 RepID=A0A9P0ACN4_BEMTA|nr:unnamed protein product [Bemisia tabaci]
MSQPTKSKKLPLPPGWIAYPSRSHPGRVYFYHSETRQSIWQDRITEVFDLSNSDENAGLIPDEPQLQKALETLSNAPTPLKGKSILDEAIVRPSSPVDSADQAREFGRSKLPNSSELRSLSDHLVSLSRDSFNSDSDSQKSLSSWDKVKSNCSSSKSPDSMPFNEQSAKNCIDSNSNQSALQVDSYSGYQSHICSSTPVTENLSGATLGSLSQQNNQKSCSNSLNRFFSSHSRSSSPIIDSHDVSSIGKLQNCNPSPQSDHSSNSSGSKKNEIWKRMDSNANFSCNKSSVNDRLQKARFSVRNITEKPLAPHKRNEASDRIQGGFNEQNLINNSWSHEPYNRHTPYESESSFLPSEELNLNNTWLCPPNAVAPSRSFNCSAQPQERNVWDSDEQYLSHSRSDAVLRPSNRFSHCSQNPGPSSGRSIFDEFIMGKDKAQAPPSRHNFNNKRKNDEYFQPYSDSRNTALPPLPKHDFNNHRNSDPLFLPHPKSRNMDQFPPTRHNFSNQRNSDLYFAPTHVSRNVDQHPPRKHNFNNQRSSKPHHRRNSDPHFQPHLNSRDMDQLPPPRHNSSNQRNCRPQAQSQKKYPSKRPSRLDPLAQASNRASTFRENSVQNRLLKAQKEVLSRGNPVRPPVSMEPIMHQNNPTRDESFCQNSKFLDVFDRITANSAKILSPHKMLSKFSQERPDVVKWPKNFTDKAPSSDQNKNKYRHSQKRKLDLSEDKSEMKKTETRISLKRKSTSMKVCGESMSEKSNQLNAALEKFKAPLSSSNQKSTSECSDSSSRLTCFSTDTQKKTPPQSDKVLAMESPCTFIRRRTSVEGEFPEFLCEAQSFKNPEHALEQETDEVSSGEPKNILKQKTADKQNLLASKRVQFREELEETIDLEEEDYICAEDQQMMDLDLYDCAKDNPEPPKKSTISKSQGSSVQQRLENARKIERTAINVQQSQSSETALSHKVEPNLQISHTKNEEEPMDWEDIPLPEIMTQVEQTRYFMSMCQQKTTANWLPEQSSITFPPKAEFCIVIDTNIFLSKISFVVRIRDTYFKGLGLPTIVVPWQVVQEIDSLKDRGSTKIKTKANIAKNFLFENLSNKNPRVRGQTMQEHDECQGEDYVAPDDMILKCAIKLIKSGKSVELLTDDKNLVSKAKINNICAYTREQMEQRLNEEKANQACSNLEPTSPADTKLDILTCALKTDLMEYFSVVIKKGMSECFGEKNWAKHCCIKPPWTAISDCLTVLEKHGLSICCKQIPKTHFTKAVKEVQMFFVSQEKGSKVTIPTLMLSIKAIDVVIRFLGAENAFKDDSQVMLKKIEELRKQLSEIGLGTKVNCNSKPDSSHSSAEVEVVFHNVIHPIADQQTTVQPPDSQSLVRVPVSVSSALDRSYIYCKNMCATMCCVFHIPNDLTDVEIVDKKLSKLKDEHTKLKAFIRDLICSFGSLEEAKASAELLSLESDYIDEINEILTKFLNGYLNVSPPIEIPKVDTFQFFTDPQYASVRERGFLQLQELQKLLVKCSSKFKELNVI